jgi:hypothetical protein
MDRNYLFICGCPRSGTTALHELVSLSPYIACGVERYYLRLLYYDDLKREHFGKERFFRPVEEDTHYLDPQTSKFKVFYQGLFERFDEALWVGDKIPGLYRKYASIQREFGRPKILFIYRNVFDVCLSYNKRLLAPQDPWETPPETGVLDWNQSLVTTLQAVEHGMDILCLSFEELFLMKSEEEVNRLFRFLEVPVPEKVLESDVMQRSPDTVGETGDTPPLSAVEKLLISMKANTPACQRMHDLVLQQKQESR